MSSYTLLIVEHNPEEIYHYLLPNNSLTNEEVALLRRANGVCIGAQGYTASQEEDAQAVLDKCGLGSDDAEWGKYNVSSKIQEGDGLWLTDGQVITRVHSVALLM